MKKKIGSKAIAVRAWEVGLNYNPYLEESRRYRQKLSDPNAEDPDPLMLDEFIVLGNGADRVALLGPDGVVYKVPHSQWFIPGRQFSEEIRLFDHLDAEGVGWCPDYWQWGSQVLAMKKYDEVEYTSSLEDLLNEMDTYSDDVGVEQIGRDPDTGDIVLLDGGCSYVPLGIGGDAERNHYQSSGG